MTTAAALLHPVRLRIVQSLVAGGEQTTHQLHERLPDIPVATLYRHVAHLARHGLIEVATEQRVRGASERTYRLAPEFANPTPEEVQALGAEQLRTAFTVFVSGLIQDFGDYLDDNSHDLAADRVSFAQASFWASDAELDAFTRTLTTALEQLLAHQPAPGRRRRLHTTVIMPSPRTDPPDT